MPCWKPPTGDEIEKIKIHLNHPNKVQVFFAKLENPLWLEPLDRAGFFSQIPEPIETEDGGISFQAWPQGKYLKRVADENPKSVIEIALRNAKTNNPYACADLAEAIGSISSTMCKSELRDVLALARAWVMKDQHGIATDELVNLIGWFYSQESRASALALTASLFESHPTAVSDTGLYFEGFYIPAISMYNRSPALCNLADILSKNLSVFEVRKVRDLLYGAIRKVDKEKADCGNDHSDEWAREISGVTSKSDEPELTLVNCLARLSSELVAEGTSLKSQVIKSLKQFEYPIFARILAFVLRENLDLYSEDDVVNLLRDERDFYTYLMEPDYSRMLRAWFPKFSPEAKRQVCIWIENGPPPAEVKQIEEHWNDEQDRARQKELWQLARLSWIEGELPSELTRLKTALAAKHEIPEMPEFRRSDASWVGPTSPLDQEQLSSMSIAELVNFLRDWKSDDGFMAASPEGLGRLISSDVSARPVDYLENLNVVRDIHPTYVREVVSGLEKSKIEISDVHWVGLIRLFDWVTGLKSEAEGQRWERNQDPGWAWTKKAIGSFLDGTLRDRGPSFTPDTCRMLLRIVVSLLEEENPSLEHETQFGGDNMFPSTLAINTVRGYAMHALFSFTWWAFQSLKDQDKSWSGFSSIGGLEEVLTQRLDKNIEPTQTIRSVFGWWLPFIENMDQVWFQEHVDAIFLEDGQISDQGWAALGTFLTFRNFNSSLYPPMKEILMLAMRRIGATEDISKFDKKMKDALAASVLSLYWMEEVQIDERESPLSIMFEIGDADMWATAFSAAGRAMNAGEEVPREAVWRICQLWDKRAGNLNEDGNVSGGGKEFKTFGHWFAATNIDNEWAFDRASQAIKMAGPLSDERMIVEALIEKVEEHPKKCANLLWEIISGKRPKYDHLPMDANLLVVLEKLNETGSREARSQVLEIANFLGGLGYVEKFRAFAS